MDLVVYNCRTIVQAITLLMNAFINIYIYILNLEVLINTKINSDVLISEIFPKGWKSVQTFQ